MKQEDLLLLKPDTTGEIKESFFVTFSRIIEKIEDCY